MKKKKQPVENPAASLSLVGAEWEQRESNRVRNPLLPNIFYKSCFSSPTIGPTFRILYSAAVLLNELKHRKYKNDFLFSHYNF